MRNMAIVFLSAVALFTTLAASAGKEAPPPATPTTTIPTGYFSSQTFSTFTNTSQGTLCGSNFTITHTGTIDQGPWIWTYSPGTPPAGSGMPASLPMFEWGATGTNAIVTVTLDTPLNPADHIFLEDIDLSERLKLEFFDAANTLIDPINFQINAVSTSGAPTVTQNHLYLQFDSPANTNLTEPFVEIMPDGLVNPVKKIQVTGTNGGNSTVEMYFSCSQPPVTAAFSPLTIPNALTSTLTFTVSAINGNPLVQTGFTNTLPSGLRVAASPNVVNTCLHGSSVTAPAGGSTVTLQDLSLSFGNAVGPTCTIAVDVTNAPGQYNPNCGSNPAAFTNTGANLAMIHQGFKTTGLATCLQVLAPPRIDSFTPSFGHSGETLIITGQYLTGASAVLIGGQAAASFTVDSDTQITAGLGLGASGPISVTTTGGTGASLTDFIYMGQWLYLPLVSR